MHLIRERGRVYEYTEADVARFLKRIYTSADVAMRGEDAALPAVVRLAHALDAAPVLAAAQCHTLAGVWESTSITKIVEAAELAALCGWDDVRTESVFALLDDLQAQLGAAATPAQQALNDVEAFNQADALFDACTPQLAQRVVGTLAANFRRQLAQASAAARAAALHSPAAAAAADLASADSAAIEADGRFLFLTPVPPFSANRLIIDAAFKSHGLDWKLALEPNGRGGGGKQPCVGFSLVRGWP